MDPFTVTATISRARAFATIEPWRPLISTAAPSATVPLQRSSLVSAEGCEARGDATGRAWPVARAGSAARPCVHGAGCPPQPTDKRQATTMDFDHDVMELSL